MLTPIFAKSLVGGYRMDLWKRSKIKKDVSIIQALRSITDGGNQMALVVDDDDVLLGVITDSDVRRAMMDGISLEEPSYKIMNSHPFVLKKGMSRDEVIRWMQNSAIHEIPMVNENNQVEGIISFTDYIKKSNKSNPVVIMAGGEGTRLRPLTETCPKPLLKIGNKPILEILLNNLSESGFNNVYMAINYKGEMIKDYFGSGGQFGVNISYIEEKKPMGTAGALRMMQDIIKDPFLVVNADLLTNLNFDNMLSFHIEENVLATMAVREYIHYIPYGVIDVDEGRIKAIKEKPSRKFFINAGIYALNPDIICKIPEDERYDMTQLFENIIERGFDTAVFPIQDYWLDIGNFESYSRAQKEYVNN